MGEKQILGPWNPLGHLSVDMSSFFVTLLESSSLGLICDALSHNRENVTLLVTWLADIIDRYTLLVLIWYQNQVYNTPPTFWDITIYV